MKTLALIVALALPASLAFAESAPAPAAPTAPATPPPANGPKHEGHEGHEGHPHIRMAIHALEGAVRHMRAADHDFGGHREAAVKSSEEAIKQLREALAFDKDHEGKHEEKHEGKREEKHEGKHEDGAESKEGREGKHHPPLRAAIHDLEAAVKQIKEARHDFGGHREAALKASEAALRDLREAVRFAKEHHEGKDRDGK